MHDPSAILFSTVLEFLPLEEARFGKKLARELYSKLSSEGPYAYDDIQMLRDGHSITLSAVRGTVHSACRIEPHSITIEERKPEFDVEEFVGIVSTVLSAASETKHLRRPIILQRTRIQCLAQPSSCTDSLDLLAAKLAPVFDKVDPFGRQPAHFGVRFRFNPQDDEDAPSWYSVRLETYSSDRTNVFMEISASHVVLPPLEATNADGLQQNIRDAYQFLTTNCREFLEQFDIPSQEE